MEHSNYLYFAYGSNMCRVKMNARKTVDNERIKFNKVWTSRLRGWKLCFDVLGAPPSDPCFASITPDEGSSVYGVTYSLETEQDWTQLQVSEGISDRHRLSWYTVIQVEVECLDNAGNVVEKLRARTLTTNPMMRLSRLAAPHTYPSVRYMSILIRGAETEKLPEEYIDTLRSVQTARKWVSTPLFVAQCLAFPALVQCFKFPGAKVYSWPYRVLIWRLYEYREVVTLNSNPGFIDKLKAFICFVGLVFLYGLYAVPGIIFIVTSNKLRTSFANMAGILRQSNSSSAK